MTKPELSIDARFAVNVFGWRYHWYVVEGCARDGYGEPVTQAAEA
jgi:hypothetical protein